MKDRSAYSEKDEKQLRGATAWQRPAAKIPEPIGLPIEQFLSSRKTAFTRSEQILKVWESVLPESVRQHCRAAGFQSGVLTIEVSAGPFLHRMQTLKNELLTEINRQCRGCGLREIRILPGYTRRKQETL